MDPKEIAREFVDWIYSIQEGIIGERFWSQHWSFEFRKKWMYFQGAERRSASQEEHCIMEIVTCYVHWETLI
jgi:hypothetical protein